MRVILSHPTGNANVRAVIIGLCDKRMLVEFDTTLFADGEAIWIKLLPHKIREEFLRRTYPLPSKKVWTHPRLELTRLILSKIGMLRYVHPEQGYASTDAVYQNFDKAVANRLRNQKYGEEINAVYAYEDGAQETFTVAKAQGIKCVYDLPIAYWETSKRLLAEEAERLPEWAVTLGGGIKDSDAKLERKTREMEMADVVVAPGQFVIESIPAWAQQKEIIVSPFGSPQTEPILKGSIKKMHTRDRPLRILFVGSMGQRKGLGDLFNAVNLLKGANIELIVMGSLLAPMSFYKRQLNSFTYEKGRSHKEVLTLMRSCDVFCLPSIVEGRALVMQEAMSQGLPLIITANTGGSDLIKEGHTGFLVPIRSPTAIAEKISWFLDYRSEVSRMGKLAQEHAAKYTWKAYGETIVERLSELYNNRN